MRFQYMHGPSTLGTTEPIYIQHLRWRPDEAATTFGPASFTCTIDLSTAATTTATMSTTFNNNHGADRARVPEGVTMPPGTLVMGVPGKVRRPLTPEEDASIKWYADNYVRYRLDFQAEGTPA